MRRVSPFFHCSISAARYAHDFNSVRVGHILIYDMLELRLFICDFRCHFLALPRNFSCWSRSILWEGFRYLHGANCSGAEFMCVCLHVMSFVVG